MKTHKIEYLLNGKIKTWKPDNQDGNFTTVYKSFWKMVKDNNLYKKSTKPIQIINCWEMEGIYTTPHPLSRYTVEELGI